MKQTVWFFILSTLLAQVTYAQSDSSKTYFDLDYSFPQTYEIADIEITGTEFLDKSVLKILSGLTIDQKIKVPGDDISKAIKKLWKQKLFANIEVSIRKIKNNRIVVQFYLQEKPRLSKFSIRGLRKSQSKSLREEIHLKSGQIITDNVIGSVENEIIDFYVDKGYLNTSVKITQEEDDPARNTAKLRIEVDKGDKIKINDIIFTGTTVLPDKKLVKLLSSTKPKRRLLARSRYIENDYEDDKQYIIDKYNSLGYRDAYIISDSIYRHNNKTINIQINISEGSRYYFRDIKWVGNTKYDDELLNSVLKIKRGDIYDQSVLDTRLNMNPNGIDVTTLYMDDGYLFFSVTPVEVLVENDSIDLEVRIIEGPQATINEVTVRGNTKTSDHVILRELRTKPGQKFSRSDITRSLRELSQLGYFDPEQLNVEPTPNPASGTVDIEYTVAERASDQIELSGGFGAGTVVGTLGLSLTNFSARKLFKPHAWSPVPSGDGQSLSIRAQSNGTFFQSYNFSFTEPWLGGKKPNSFSISLYRSIQSNGRKRSDPNYTALFTTGVVVGLGKRLKWPDDFFTARYSVNYQRYFNKFFLPNVPLGRSNNLSFNVTLSRNSLDRPIYPFSGSNISLSLQFTPPYSWFSDKDYETIPDEEKFKFIEFHKWKFDAEWFHTIAGKLVLRTRTNFGFLGLYDRDLGITQFERFWVGGSGLTGFNLDGRELIALRGYQDNSLTPISPFTGTREGGTIYNRYTIELRYPVSLAPTATVYGLAFVEGGNAWLDFKNFNPFEVKRSAGVGVRVFLPMFGLLGLDWGYGFDEVPFNPGVNKGNFHFIIGQQF